MGLLFAGVAIAVFVLVMTRARHERQVRRAAAATTRLEADEGGGRRWMVDGRYEEGAWDELQEGRGIRVPKGPWGSRVRLVFDGGGERGCIVPMDVAEHFGALAALTQPPGFDHRRLAEVLEEERTGQEVLWRRTTT